MADDKADDKERGSFWTSVPGMLTGAASLITAIVAALAFFERDNAAPPAAALTSSQKSAAVVSGVPATPAAPSERSPASTPATRVTALPPDDPQHDVTSCQRIAGRWVWSTGGVVNIGEDGSLQWRQRATDSRPALIGRWVCTSPKERQYLFSWSHGFSDVFALSADGQRVAGTNQQTNTPLFGNRQN